ncbi:MAG: hypothetical protein ACLFU9_01655 [Candidatus Bathyarchaeia archaeon]
MSLSPLSSTIERASNLLRSGASNQINDYESCFALLKTFHESFLSNLIVSNFSIEKAYDTARKYFGSTSMRFAAIDGTMYSRPLFDLVIFFGGAYASTGMITFMSDSKPVIRYDTKAIQHGTGISSVAPIYINEVPNIDQTFFSPEQPEEVALNQPLQDTAIINNATVANWIMTFAEYYLAYKLATDPKQKTQVILLDRSLSTEQASLLYDTSKREHWKTKSSLLDYEIDGTPIDINDLTLGRQHIQNQALDLPPARADYLRYAIIHHLTQQRSPISKTQILQQLGITDNKRAKRAEKYLKKSVKENILTGKNQTYTINPKYATTWNRLKRLVTILGDRFFYTQTLETPTANPMKIQKNEKEQWLTTLDIAFLTLFTLQMLIEACWNNRILLIGITKDTAARDMKRQLIPILNNEGVLQSQVKPEDYAKLPNTDRFILQSASLFNPEKTKIPWSLTEYDSAFRTMIPDPQTRKGHVLGAIKNRISLEKTFLKTYVQLAQAKKDSLMRSNVLLVDRLVIPEYDYTPDTTMKFWNEFGGAKEPVEIILYKDKTVPNPIQNLTMTILAAMTPHSIPEAFGHNKPLFIADKIAKWHYSQFKRVADTTANWILNNHKLKKFVYYMNTFRERRAAIEATRRETT